MLQFIVTVTTPSSLSVSHIRNFAYAHIYIYYFSLSLSLYIYMAVSHLFGLIKRPNWTTLTKIRGGGTFLRGESAWVLKETQIQALVTRIVLRIKSYAGYPCSNPNFDEFLTFPWISLDFGQIRSDASDPFDRSNASDPWIRSIGSIQCIGSMDRVNRIDPVHRIQANNFFTESKDGEESKWEPAI